MLLNYSQMYKDIIGIDLDLLEQSVGKVDIHLL